MRELDRVGAVGLGEPDLVPFAGAVGLEGDPSAVRREVRVVVRRQRGCHHGLDRASGLEPIDVDLKPHASSEGEAVAGGDGRGVAHPEPGDQLDPLGWAVPRDPDAPERAG